MVVRYDVRGMFNEFHDTGRQGVKQGDNADDIDHLREAWAEIERACPRLGFTMVTGNSHKVDQDALPNVSSDGLLDYADTEIKDERDEHFNRVGGVHGVEEGVQGLTQVHD